MAKKNRGNHWESSLLAAVLAVAGTLFIFDRLGSLIQGGMFCLRTVTHTSPALLVVVGLTLLLAEGTTAQSNGGKDDLKQAPHE
jgi:hypothetical protein